MTNNGWHTGELPKRPGLYLCTFYGDSIMEYYVAPCEFICQPVHAFTKFMLYDYTFGVSKVPREDLTDQVIAWMPFPEPYEPVDSVSEEMINEAMQILSDRLSNKGGIRIDP